ncbi:hypothetical protein [Tunicatimonas pelagia]|uniref:hypothetical protein n=1 Tax=Tunicatimonas pelagia TaxID=931531 RepID=UPI0026651D70|nr:hypothetical protein [Tunicatimonas pelagia]WKN44108.1 hypothetical protein P0M28_03895 [Tunicatimonas pelagia]
MKHLFYLTFFLFLFYSSTSQAQFLFNFGIDAYKTDNRDPFEFVDKAQFSVEANYFLIRQLALTAGVEYWTAPNRLSFIPGMRLYPIDPIFLRLRPLISDEVDYAAGLGYGRAINNNWRIEVIGDYYFERGNAALRVGVGYRL